MAVGTLMSTFNFELAGFSDSLTGFLISLENQAIYSFLQHWIRFITSTHLVLVIETRFQIELIHVHRHVYVYTEPECVIILAHTL